MKGWLFHGAKKPLELIERDDPSAGPGQAIHRCLPNGNGDRSIRRPSKPCPRLR